MDPAKLLLKHKMFGLKLKEEKYSGSNRLIRKDLENSIAMWDPFHDRRIKWYIKFVVTSRLSLTPHIKGRSE